MKDVLDWFTKINSRSLLIVFVALTLLTAFPEFSPLDDPFSIAALSIPSAMLMSYLLVIGWLITIGRFNLSLPEGDYANMGVFIGGSGLAYCLCILFWYVSSTPDPLNVKILGDVGFVRLFTLYLLSVVTMQVPRYPAAADRHVSANQ
ncbi:MULTISPECIES: hypothetical protein [unclassified Pseudomonas]|jgi:hypothetical protein|uniref:hypothetical protein n=1 Tax=unclassified Pseudomonas TaxID=196821 RepID=UPI000778B808|nr:MULTISPECIES: hypothetical protein [unclassified Pseudomonas]KYC14112.1 hypothetical protein WM94_28440 [Pseudomonas sp. ABFPK]